MLEHARMQELDVLYENYIVKKKNLFRNAGSGFANLTARLLLDLPDSHYLSSCRCVSRLSGEHIAVNSSPYIYIWMRRDPRGAGCSGYRLRRLIRLWRLLLTSYSLMPLRFATLVGLGAAALGGLSLLYILVSAAFGAEEVVGWASVISFILFFGGIRCLLLAVIEEYTGRVYPTVYGKPQAHIRSTEGYGSLKPPLNLQSSRSTEG